MAAADSVLMPAPAMPSEAAARLFRAEPVLRPAVPQVRLLTQPQPVLARLSPARLLPGSPPAQNMLNMLNSRPYCPQESRGLCWWLKRPEVHPPRRHRRHRRHRSHRSHRRHRSHPATANANATNANAIAIIANLPSQFQIPESRRRVRSHRNRERVFSTTVSKPLARCFIHGLARSAFGCWRARVLTLGSRIRHQVKSCAIIVHTAHTSWPSSWRWRSLQPWGSPFTMSLRGDDFFGNKRPAAVRARGGLYREPFLMRGSAELPLPCFLARACAWPMSYLSGLACHKQNGVTGLSPAR